MTSEPTHDLKSYSLRFPL